MWLKLLLQGTPNSQTFRAHSLKTTLLVWAAKAGLDKEVRAVLGHHCTATEGSEVVYSRFLQVRALRKLQMLLKRVRIGLGLDYDPVYGEAFPVTPLQQPRAAPTPTMVEGQVRTPAETVGPVEHAVEYVRDNEEECEAKRSTRTRPAKQLTG